MQLFYHHELVNNSLECTFDAIESQHIVRVLRKKEEDILMITNGKGLLFKSEISSAHDKRCRVKIISVSEHNSNRSYYLNIVIAPTKNMDRLEWFVEKATEIGVDEISLVIGKHSERKVVKTERLEKVMVAAMKQSAQFYLPKLSEVMTLDAFFDLKFDGQRFIAHCEKTQKYSFKKAIQPNKPIQILIGPEGDFSDKEIEKALQLGFVPVTFGENRLRTETAGIVAVHTVSLMNE